jgi:hypothetical protein
LYFAVVGTYSQRIKLLMNAIALTGAVLFAGTACGPDEVRLEGVIAKDPEFEGGDCVILTTEQGDLYELSGGDRRALVDGRHVVVRGVVPEDVVSFCQLGTIFLVHEVECSSPLFGDPPGSVTKLRSCGHTPR